MIILAKLIGLVITTMGLAIFASPTFTQKLFTFFKEGKNIYYAGIFRTLIGIFLLVVASKSLVPLAAIAVGLMFLVSGIAIFAVDTEKLTSFISAYSEMPTLVVRLLGLVAASFGILVFAIF